VCLVYDPLGCQSLVLLQYTEVSDKYNISIFRCLPNIGMH